MDSRDIITSKDNQHLAAARRVRDGKESGQIFFEGRRLATEVLRSNIEVEQCFISEELMDFDLISKVGRSSKNYFFVGDRAFRSISDTDNSQGIVLITKRPRRSDAFAQVSNAPIFLLLNEISNPSNLGAIFRTAEAAGVSGVIVSKRSADTFSPKSNRASMGSNLRIPVWESADLDEVVDWARKSGLITTAASVNAEADYTNIDWKIGRVLVYGSEAHGLSGSILETLDETFVIPMDNGVESLNIGVSVGITLFEAKRQREIG